MINQNFDQELKAVRSEQQFNSFIQKYQSDPRVQKMQSMLKGRNNNEIFAVAQNIANANRIPFGEFRKFIGL